MALIAQTCCRMETYSASRCPSIKRNLEACRGRARDRSSTTPRSLALRCSPKTNGLRSLAGRDRLEAVGAHALAAFEQGHGAEILGEMNLAAIAVGGAVLVDVNQKPVAFLLQHSDVVARAHSLVWNELVGVLAYFLALLPFDQAGIHIRRTINRRIAAGKAALIEYGLCPRGIGHDRTVHVPRAGVQVRRVLHIGVEAEAALALILAERPVAVEVILEQVPVAATDCLRRLGMAARSGNPREFHEPLFGHQDPAGVTVAVKAELVILADVAVLDDLEILDDRVDELFIAVVHLKINAEIDCGALRLIADFGCLPPGSFGVGRRLGLEIQKFFRLVALVLEQRNDRHPLATDVVWFRLAVDHIERHAFRVGHIASVRQRGLPRVIADNGRHAALLQMREPWLLCGIECRIDDGDAAVRQAGVGRRQARQTKRRQSKCELAAGHAMHGNPPRRTLPRFAHLVAAKSARGQILISRVRILQHTSTKVTCLTDVLFLRELKSPVESYNGGLATVFPRGQMNTQTHIRSIQSNARS